MLPEYQRLLEKSAARYKDILKQLRFLAKRNKTGFDSLVAGFHDEVFSKINCLDCGNCCRAMSPRFRETDIKLICKACGRDPKSFKAEYLKPDEDGVGWVLRELPCPLQNEDGSCSEYELRTLSCREFPHTRSRAIQRKLAGLAHDSLVCPAAYLIAEKILALGL